MPRRLRAEFTTRRKAAVRKQSDKCGYPARFPLFIQSRVPEVVLPISRVSHLTLINQSRNSLSDMPKVCLLGDSRLVGVRGREGGGVYFGVCLVLVLVF